MKIEKEGFSTRFKADLVDGRRETCELRDDLED